MESNVAPTSMDSVQVCVRIRPLNSKEKQEQTKSCIRLASSVDGLSSSNGAATSGGGGGGPQQLIVGKDRAFTFDNVLGIASSQGVRKTDARIHPSSAWHGISP